MSPVPPPDAAPFGLLGTVSSPARGHRHAEAVEAAARGGPPAEADGGAGTGAVEVERPAAQHPALADRRAGGVLGRAVLVVILVEPVVAPLPDVAVHVIQPEGVGRVRADPGGAPQVGAAAGPAVGLAAV